MRNRRWRGSLSTAASAATLLVLLAEPARAIPSFARQTKLPCSACHTQFPELNAFGRVFKLNGYTLRMIETIEAADTSGHQDLSINLMPLPSVMVQASETYTARPQPGTTNGTVMLPDQLSVFLAGAITPKIGAFIQVTYDPQSGTVDLDNTSIRYATPLTLASKPGVFGLSLNNNPTVQDVWNSTPAWGFPFAASAVAPVPAAATLVDGALAQQVAGLSAYVFWNDAIYAEFGGYRWAPQGAPALPDASVAGVVEGVAPYWRLALTRSFGDNYLEVGTYGMYARRQPGSFTSGNATDRYTDLAFDAEFQRPMGNNNLTIAGTWIHEKRSLGASVDSGFASVASQSVNTIRARATYHVGQSLRLHARLVLHDGDDATQYAVRTRVGRRQREREPQQQRRGRRGGLERVDERAAVAAVHGVHEVQRRRPATTTAPGGMPRTTTRCTRSSG